MNFESKDQLFYKQILSNNESDILNNHLNTLIDNNLVQKNTNTTLASGSRYHADIRLKDDFPHVYDCIFNVLGNDFINLSIDPNGRLYSHLYGGIKKHTDVSHDGKSDYTMLIYLTDDFEGGNLSIESNNKVFSFMPKKGYGIIFNKKLVHWASDVIHGSKNFLIVHLCSGQL